MPYRGICTNWKSERLIHSHTFVIVFSREPGFSRASLLCTLNPLSCIWNAFSVECGSLVQIEKCVKSWSLITSHLTSDWICALLLSVHSLTLRGSWIVKIFFVQNLVGLSWKRHIWLFFSTSECVCDRKCDRTFVLSPSKLFLFEADTTFHTYPMGSQIGTWNVSSGYVKHSTWEYIRMLLFVLKYSLLCHSHILPVASLSFSLSHRLKIIRYGCLSQF